MKVIDSGAPLSVSIGGATLKRIFNMFGELVDNLDPLNTRTTSPIRRSAPTFIELRDKNYRFLKLNKNLIVLPPKTREKKKTADGGLEQVEDLIALLQLKSRTSYVTSVTASCIS